MTAYAADDKSVSPTNVVLDYDLTHVDSNLKPGDSGVLQIVIRNVGPQAAEDVQLSVPETGSIAVNKKWDLGKMEPYSIKTVSSTLTVSKDAYIGLHNIQVRINYDGYDSSGKLENDQETVWDFPVRVYVSANFQIAVVKDVFSKDSAGKLVITGSTQDGAKGVSATLGPDPAQAACASVIGSSKVFVGDVSRGQDFRLEYDIKPSNVGVCSFSLLMDYSDISGNSMKENLPVSIDVQRSDADFKVSDVSYTSASPGTAVNVTVSLENLGSAQANDVSVTAQLSSPFTPIGSSERFIGDIGKHGKEDVSFRLLVDSQADVKAYEIPLTIEYFDAAGVKYAVKKTIGLALDGKPELQLFLERSDLLAPGTTGRVTLSVVNKGYAEVKFLSVGLLPTENYAVSLPAESYVGNLGSDATVTEDYEITVNKNASSGTIPLTVRLQYKETNSNVDQIVLSDVDVNVLSGQEYSARQSSGSVSPLIMGLEGLMALVALGLIVSFLSRSGAQKSKAVKALPEKEGA
ncbi:MAG: hypothetical protein WAX07_06650 [Candidatus Altiarchaeia archaeon]